MSSELTTRDTRATPSSRARLPLRLPGQARTLIQQAGAGHPIRSAHGVAVRILGFVDDLEDIDVRTYEGIGELQVHDTGAWKLADDHRAEPEDEIEIVRRTLQHHVQSLRDAKNDFNERCRVIRETGAVPEEATNAAADAGDADDDDADGGGETKQKQTGARNPGVGPLMEMRGQRFAALGILRHDGHTLVCPLGARGTVEECEAWIRDTLAKTYRDVDVYCVDMYEWIFPDVVADRICRKEIPFAYGGEGGDRLTELMQYQIDEERKQEDFEASMRHSGREESAYITELGAPTELSAA